MDKRIDWKHTCNVAVLQLIYYIGIGICYVAYGVLSGGMLQNRVSTLTDYIANTVFIFLLIGAPAVFHLKRFQKLKLNQQTKANSHLLVEALCLLAISILFVLSTLKLI